MHHQYTGCSSTVDNNTNTTLQLMWGGRHETATVWLPLAPPSPPRNAPLLSWKPKKRPRCIWPLVSRPAPHHYSRGKPRRNRGAFGHLSLPPHPHKKTPPCETTHQVNDASEDRLGLGGEVQDGRTAHNKAHAAEYHRLRVTRESMGRSSQGRDRLIHVNVMD